MFRPVYLVCTVFINVIRAETVWQPKKEENVLHTILIIKSTIAKVIKKKMPTILQFKLLKFECLPVFAVFHNILQNKFGCGPLV